MRMRCPWNETTTVVSERLCRVFLTLFHTFSSTGFTPNGRDGSRKGVIEIASGKRVLLITSSFAGEVEDGNTLSSLWLGSLNYFPLAHRWLRLHERKNNRVQDGKHEKSGGDAILLACKFFIARQCSLRRSYMNSNLRHSCCGRWAVFLRGIMRL